MQKLSRVLVLALILAAPRGALAQPNKADAIKHFEIGLELVKQEAWDSALAEFLKSRELYPTKNALKNAAFCLRELKRFDEALDMYDELLERFGTELTPAEVTTVHDDQQKLAKFVGTVIIETPVVGARIVIDGKERGTTPASRPVRVTVGTRAITVSKAGYAPFETKVMVSSGETKVVKAQLALVANIGTLRVVEAKGRAFDVVVDGAVVGKTPWEGALGAGTHSVALKGPDDVGTVARSVEVVAEKTLELSLEAAPIPGELTVDGSPSDAKVFVDGKEVGVVPWKGNVLGGEHTIELRADGYRSTSTTLRVSSGRSERYSASLEKIRRLLVEANLWFNPAQGPNADMLAEDRTAFTYGGIARVGYKLHDHFSVDVGGGYLSSSVADGAEGETPRDTIFGEKATLSGPLAMLSATAHFGHAFPILLRLNVGGWFANARFEQGIVNETSTSRDLGVYERRTFGGTIGPEVRVGVRLSRALTLDLGVAAFLSFIDEINGESRQVGGRFVQGMFLAPGQIFFVPSLGLRLEL